MNRRGTDMDERQELNAGKAAMIVLMLVVLVALGVLVQDYLADHEVTNGWAIATVLGAGGLFVLLNHLFGAEAPKDLLGRELPTGDTPQGEGRAPPQLSRQRRPPGSQSDRAQASRPAPRGPRRWTGCRPSWLGPPADPHRCRQLRSPRSPLLASTTCSGDAGPLGRAEHRSTTRSDPARSGSDRIIRSGAAVSRSGSQRAASRNQRWKASTWASSPATLILPTSPSSPGWRCRR